MQPIYSIPTNTQEQIDNGKRILSNLNQVMPTDPERAMSIAREYFSKIGQYRVDPVLCDNGLGWSAIDIGNNKEVWIGKADGSIYSPPLNLGENVFDSPSHGPVDEAKAVEILQTHFDDLTRSKFNSDQSLELTHFPSVCSLNGSWRVYFISYQLGQITEPDDIKRLANDHPPDYIVDKTSGRITFFNYLVSNN